ncbi:MAG TPA: hypothetical protein VGH33_18390 [Isosphaeraceae bacterium]
MRPPTRTWRAIPWPGALLALAAWALVAPGEAQAGCRHPGVSASGQASLLDGLDRLALGDATPLRLPTAPPAPCQGPSCSEREAPPPSPATTTHELGPRWALGSIVRPRDQAGSEAVPHADARLRPVHNPLAIFHPPRPSRSLPTS